MSGSGATGDAASNGVQVFGPTIRYKTAGTGSASVTFTPRLSQTKTDKVYGWWTAASDQATNSPYTIRHAIGTTTVRANQRVNGDRWNFVGTFSLGRGSYVRLTDGASGYVVANGILLDPN